MLIIFSEGEEEPYQNGYEDDTPLSYQQKYRVGNISSSMTISETPASGVSLQPLPVLKLSRDTGLFKRKNKYYR
jgi:hypothetical protein